MRSLSLLLMMTIGLFASEKIELPVILNSITNGSYHSTGFSDMVSTSSSEISDSHLFTSKYRKKTIITLGTDYVF